MSGTVTAPKGATRPPPAPPRAQSLGARLASQDQAAISQFNSIPQAPPPPELRQLPRAPSEAPSTPAQGLMHWGTVLAIFGSLLTRAPLTTAMKAAGASMQAYNAGRYRDYQLSLAKFRTDLQAAIAQNQQELQSYNSSLALMRTNIEAGMDKLRGTALLHHDELMLAQLQQNGALGAARLAVMREGVAARLAGVQAQLRENAEKNRLALITLQVENGGDVPLSVLKEYGLAGPSADPPTPGKSPGTAVQSSDGALTSTIKGVPSFAEVLQRDKGVLAPDFLRAAYLVANYREKPSVVLSTMGSRPGFRVKFMGEVSRINPAYNAQNYAMESAARERWAAGAGSEQIRSFATAIYHLSSLRQFVAQLGNTAVMPVNAVVNYVRAITGNSAVTNFATAKTVVTSEVMNALQGHATVSEANRLEEQFRDANSPAQLMGAIHTAGTLLEGRLSVIKEQIAGQTGDPTLSDRLIPQDAVKLLSTFSAVRGQPPSGAVPSASAVGASAGAVAVGQRARLANGEIVQWTGSAWVAVGR